MQVSICASLSSCDSVILQVSHRASQSSCKSFVKQVLHLASFSFSMFVIWRVLHSVSSSFGMFFIQQVLHLAILFMRLVLVFLDASFVLSWVRPSVGPSVRHTFSSTAVNLGAQQSHIMVSELVHFSIRSFMRLLYAARDIGLLPLLKNCLHRKDSEKEDEKEI